MAKHKVELVLAAYDQASAKIGGVEKAVSSMVRNVAGMVGGYLGARSILNFAIGSVKEYAEYETAFIRLAAGLQMLGDRSGTMAGRMRASANELQKLSGIEDNIIIRSMALGAALGHLSGDKLLAATRAAIGWATILDRDVNETMLMVVRAANGNVTAFSRLGVAFDEGATAAQNFNRVLAEGEEGFATTQALAGTMERRIKDLSNEWKNFKQQTGKELVPYAEEATVWAKGLLAISPAIFLLKKWGELMWPKHYGDKGGKPDLGIIGKYGEGEDDPEIIKKTANETNRYDDIIRRTAEDVYRLKYGEEKLEQIRFRMGGANVEQQKKLQMLQEEKKHIREITKAEEDRARAEEKRREMLRDITRELSTEKMDRWQKMFYELIQGGAPRGILEQLIGPLSGLSGLEKYKGLGPRPGWAPFESYHLRGITGPPMSISDQEREAKNAAEYKQFIKEVIAILKELLRIFGNKETLNIQTVDLN